jgi:hypothetical protein
MTRKTGIEGVSADDVLYYLASGYSVGSNAKSSLGGQLEQLKAGRLNTTAKERREAPWMAPPKKDQPDHRNVDERFHANAMRTAHLDRCVRGFRAQQRVRGRHEPIILGELAIASKMHEGEIAARALSAFQVWATKSEEQALAAVYALMRSIKPDLPDVAQGVEVNMAQAFRVGKGRRARSKAAALWADARLALDDWLTDWNARIEREARKAS